MNKLEKIATSDVKKYNKNRVFKLIYFAEKISRQEIAGILKLSLPTVNQNLKALAQEDLIYYEGNFDSTGGRKAQVISVNPAAAYAICVNLYDKGFGITLVDLKCNVVDSKTYNVTFSLGDDYAKKVGKSVVDIIRKNSVADDKVLGVGITVPGVFDKSNRIILAAPTMGLKDYHIGNITAHIPYDCVAMNDARAGAYAEYWFERRKKSREIMAEDVEKSTMSDLMEGKMYVMLDNGVGGAYIGSDHIVRGKHNRYGEVGHMTIHPEGKQCFCGKKGCFESYVSARCISSEIGLTLDEFFSRLDMGDAVIEQYFENYIEDLAIGINNLYVMTDGDIVIAGPVSVYLEKYIDDIRKKLVKKYSFDTDGTYFGLASCDYELSKTGAALTYIGEFINRV
ncbi:MAG: ROK family transcriptional regulator [Lachnospira sp.]|nr:ROK family transcriptional regulator [Lachnospira sp.]